MADLPFSLLVLNKDFLATYAISEFNSFIWTERYWACGDFQLETIFLLDIFQNVKVGNYLYLDGSKYLMIVESIRIGYDPASRTSQTLTIIGRSIESILDRRIAWGEWGSSYKQSIGSIIQSVLLDNVIAPSDSKRRMGIIRFKNGVTGGSVAISGYCDNVYDIVQALCQTDEIGFRMLYTDGNDYVEFELYQGVDHSYNQSVNPPVIFSSSFENLGISRYTIDVTEYKTFAYAAGPEETTEIRDPETGDVIQTVTDRTIVHVGDNSATGLERKEMYVSSSSSVPDEVQQAAMEKLAKINTMELLDSELDTRRQFVYGRDFSMGDIVQIVTDFGLDARARITEFIRSWDSNGYTEVPTFEIVED